MATDDQSLATLVESWIVAALIAIEAPDLVDRNVEVFKGTVNASGQPMMDELSAGPSPRIHVLFEHSDETPLAEGQSRYRAVYGIYIVVSNERGAAARRGDGSVVGTNKLRDLFRAALHDKSPDKSGGGYHTERTVWKGERTVWQEAGKWVIRCEMILDESPTAA